MDNNIKYIIENSIDVKINKDNIDKIVPYLKKIEYHHWFDNSILNLDEKKRILLMFLCESLNYCFFEKPKFMISYHDKSVKGTEAIFSCILKEIEDNKNFLNLNYLKNITREHFNNIIKSDNKLPLLNTRYDNFMDTIQTINNMGEEEFYNQIFSINSDLDLLKFITANFKSFQDISKYQEKQIFFYKRAILLVVDLYNVSTKIKNNIKNINSLWAGADYSLPRVLRDYGILEYSQKLSAIIDNGILLEHDSREEIEIRANTIYAVGLIKERLNNQYNAVTLDNMIWNLGASYKSKKQYYYTYTIYY